MAKKAKEAPIEEINLSVPVEPAEEVPQVEITLQFSTRFREDFSSKFVVDIPKLEHALNTMATKYQKILNAYEKQIRFIPTAEDKSENACKISVRTEEGIQFSNVFTFEAISSFSVDLYSMTKKIVGALDEMRAKD